LSIRLIPSSSRFEIWSSHAAQLDCLDNRCASRCRELCNQPTDLCDSKTARIHWRGGAAGPRLCPKDQPQRPRPASDRSNEFEAIWRANLLQLVPRTPARSENLRSSLKLSGIVLRCQAGTIQLRRTLALTPTLSPEEREKDFVRCSTLTDQRLFPARPKAVPSPGGEGQGEGERIPTE